MKNHMFPPHRYSLPFAVIVLLAAMHVQPLHGTGAAGPASKPVPAYRTVYRGEWSVRLTAFPTLAGPAVSEMAENLAGALIQQNIGVSNHVSPAETFSRSRPEALPALIKAADEPLAAVVEDWRQSAERLAASGKMARSTVGTLRRSERAEAARLLEELPEVLVGFADVCRGLADTCRADADLLKLVAHSFDKPASRELALCCWAHAAELERVASALDGQEELFTRLGQELKPAVAKSR